MPLFPTSQENARALHHFWKNKDKNAANRMNMPGYGE